MTVRAAPPVAGARALGTRAAAALFAAGVTALGLYGLGFLAALPRRLPSPSDWRELAARLGREARPGDAVALAPWWAERARAVLPAGVPVLAFPRLAGEDLPGVRRVWVLALPGAPGGQGQVLRDLAARGRRTVPPIGLGGLALSRYDLDRPLLPLFRLTERLDGASASAAGRPCPRDADGALRCPGRGGPRISRELREVDYLPRSCVLVQPSPGVAPLTLSLPDAPVGRALRVFTGIVGEAALQGRAPVEVTVALDGHVVGRAEEPPAAPGWHRTELDTAALAGQHAALTITLRTADPSPRPFCLEAYALP